MVVDFDLPVATACFGVVEVPELPATGGTYLTRIVGLENVKPAALIRRAVPSTDTAVVAAFFSPVDDSITSATNCDFDDRLSPHKHDAMGSGTNPL